MVTALYRRYRPDSFSDMIGQAQVTEPIMTALRSSKIGHAYLFSGPRGCGKTTSARILARCLNCHNGPTDTPCGTCPSCIELGRDGGGSLDVIEIDAASHGGVDDARDLRERAIFAPARDRFKIFIIDEAHMVSPQGFNALLKIVEEPPEHVKFIFATTEPEKVIGTIRSRTHHFPFRLVAPAPLLEYTASMCKQEGVNVEEGVLPLVIRAGGGSVRDTLSILDQLIAGSEGNTVTLNLAVGLLGYTPEDLLNRVIDAVKSNDSAAAISSIDQVIQTGQDPRRFVEDLLEKLRDLIIVQATDVDGASAVLRGLSEEQLSKLFEQATKFNARSLSAIADIVSETLDKMAGATAPRLQLELMAARILVAQSTSSEGVSAQVVQGQNSQQQPQQAQQPLAQRQTQQAPAQQPAQQTQQRLSQAAPSQAAAPQVVAPQAVAPQAAVPQVAPPQATPNTATPAAPSQPVAGISFAEAARNARAFLAGEQQPSTPSRNEQEAPAVSVPVPEPQTPEAQIPESQTPEFNLVQVREALPSILEELAASDSKAATVAKKFSILDVADRNLVIGYQNAEDLNDFKKYSAAPLRSLISTKFNTEFSYVPKLDATSAGQMEEVSAPVGSSSEEAVAPPEASATEVSGSESAVFEASVSEPSVPEPAVPEPSEPDLPEPPEDAYYEPSESTMSVAPVPNHTADSATVVEPEPEAKPEPETKRPRLAPEEEIIRYGESVVREQLNAKFIKEIPLTESPEY